MSALWLKSALFAISLCTVSAYAVLEDAPLESSEDSMENEMEPNGLEMTAENPLAPFAVKKNGKIRKRFNVPFQTLIDYYKYTSKGSILVNPNPEPLLDLDLEPLEDKQTGDLKFRIDFQRRKTYPLKLINPHSVSQLFIVDPQEYASLAGEEDFLSAKRAIYNSNGFNERKLRYQRNKVHMEDWRSLNHPPVHDLGEDLTVWDKDYSPIDYTQHESNFYKVDFQRKIDEISDAELTFGNKVELLENGKSFERKKEEIKKAKKSVLMAVMSFFCDSSSNQLEKILVDKVKEGVDVKLMVERVWTKIAMKTCMRRMIKGGVDVVYANDLLKKGEEMALFHNKFMIIDNEKVIMGGSNIVESDNISTGFNHMNRDNDVYIEGPIVADALYTFTQLFKKYEKRVNEKNQQKNPNIKDISTYEELALSLKKAEREAGVRGSDAYEQKLADPVARNAGVCRFVTQAPGSDKHRLSKIFIEHFNHAEKQLNLTTGSISFALPTDKEKEQARETWNKRLFESIFAANARGARLDLIGNGIDGGYGEASNMINRLNHKNRFHFKPIMKTLYTIMTSWLDKGAAKKNAPYMEYIQSLPNARAWQNFQYMHSKLIQLDRTVSIVSSYNLEEWSADKSHESGVICMDERLNREMDRSFIRDFVNSVPAVSQK